MSRRPPRARLLLAACAASALGGCFSLIPLPSRGKAAPAKIEVDGKIFGTGTMVIEPWQLTVLVDPASVDVEQREDRLLIRGPRGGRPDPIHGGFELTMWKKQPGQTARDVLARELAALDPRQKPHPRPARFASFDLTGLEELTSGTSAIGTIKAVEHGGCIFELLLVAPDAEQLARLEVASEAGILARSGKTPMPAICR